MHFPSHNPAARAAILVTALLLTSPAFAHDGNNHAIGLANGFKHPLLGLDHVLAMLAVGLWAGQYTRLERWMVLLLFPATMALGAVAGMMVGYSPGIEAGVAGSVAVLGLLILFPIKMPVWGGSIAVSMFALIHGYVHGVELPAGVSPVLYGAGFILATLSLLMIGLTIGLAANGNATGKAMRLLGSAIAAAGAYLLVGAG